MMSHLYIPHVVLHTLRLTYAPAYELLFLSPAATGTWQSPPGTVKKAVLHTISVADRIGQRE